MPDRAHIFCCRSVQSDDDGAEDTEGTPDFAEEGELLFQEDGRQDGTERGQKRLSELPVRFKGMQAYQMTTERAPMGVTSTAGAKAYAAKLQISPTTITEDKTGQLSH